MSRQYLSLRVLVLLQVFSLILGSRSQPGANLAKPTWQPGRDSNLAQPGEAQPGQPDVSDSKSDYDVKFNLSLLPTWLRGCRWTLRYDPPQIQHSPSNLATNPTWQPDDTANLGNLITSTIWQPGLGSYLAILDYLPGARTNLATSTVSTWRRSQPGAPGLRNGQVSKPTLCKMPVPVR